MQSCQNSKIQLKRSFSHGQKPYGVLNDMNIAKETLKSIPWILAEFHHNRMVQSPHENHFNVSGQHNEE